MGSLSWLDGPDWPGVTLRFSTRAGGVSSPPFDALNLGQHVGDAPDAVAENRHRVCTVLPGLPFWLDQVHGQSVIDADHPSSSLNGVPEADAAMTQTPGRVLAIMVADCLPVAISNAKGTVLGVAHAGWRGLANGVLEQTLDAMRTARPDDCSELQAWIGPAIGPTAFEVGDEVRAAFVQHDPDSRFCFAARVDVAGKWWADLPALAERRLRRAGVAHVFPSGRCTFSEPDHFFSYRRDGQTGRMALFAWLNAG